MTFKSPLQPCSSVASGFVNLTDCFCYDILVFEIDLGRRGQSQVIHQLLRHPRLYFIQLGSVFPISQESTLLFCSDLLNGITSINQAHICTPFLSPLVGRLYNDPLKTLQRNCVFFFSMRKPMLFAEPLNRPHYSLKASPKQTYLTCSLKQ